MSLKAKPLCHCCWTYIWPLWLTMKRISLILTNADFRIKLLCNMYTIFAPSYMHVSMRILCWATILAFLYCLLSCGFEFCSMFSKVTVPKVLFIDRRFSLWTSTNLTICTPTPWLTLLLVLGKSRVKQNSC